MSCFKNMFSRNDSASHNLIMYSCKNEKLLSKEVINTMYRKNNRYVFSGCSVHSTQNPAMSCGCGDIEFTEASTTREYARLFVEPQQYENCACPEYALKNGTFFNALYMPYRTNSECGTSVMDSRCLSNSNLINKSKCTGGCRNGRMR